MENDDLVLSKSILRPWRLSDATSLSMHANNKHVSEYLRDGFPHPYSYEDAVWWITSVGGKQKDLIYAIDVNLEAVGGIGIHMKEDVYRLSGEIGYWLGEDFWNRGIVSEAVKALVDLAFRETELIRIFACVYENNTASMRVLEKCGFIREAKHRKAVIKNDRVMDEIVYAIIKGDPRQLP